MYYVCVCYTKDIHIRAMNIIDFMYVAISLRDSEGVYDGAQCPEGRVETSEGRGDKEDTVVTNNGGDKLEELVDTWGSSHMCCTC